VRELESSSRSRPVMAGISIYPNGGVSDMSVDNVRPEVIRFCIRFDDCQRHRDRFANGDCDYLGLLLNV